MKTLPLGPAGRSALLILGALAAAGGALAAAAPGQRPPPPPSVYADYHPGFADMMTMAVQPRHTKLGLAIRARNWTYANYEAGELRGAFTRMTRSIPSYEGKDTATILAQINPSLDGLRKAIQDKNALRADAAYAELTASCNQCLESEGRAYIVIRTPAASSSPDQDFTARR